MIKNKKLKIERFEINREVCKEDGEKLIKIVENRSTLDGTLTFHIIKLRCPKCSKEYLDLDQAEKYDFILVLEKVIKERPLETLTRNIAI